jgi:hypothetical protein
MSVNVLHVEVTICGQLQDCVLTKRFIAKATKLMYKQLYYHPTWLLIQHTQHIKTAYSSKFNTNNIVFYILKYISNHVFKNLIFYIFTLF